MTTVPQTATGNKIPKAFFAQFGLHGEQHGVLTRPGTELVFFNTDTRQYTTITPANIHLLLLGQEVSEFMTVYYEDLGRAREERRALTAESRAA
jgi:hypothetical protein